MAENKSSHCNLLSNWLLLIKEIPQLSWRCSSPHSHQGQPNPFSIMCNLGRFGSSGPKTCFFYHNTIIRFSFIQLQKLWIQWNVTSNKNISFLITIYFVGANVMIPRLYIVSLWSGKAIVRREMQLCYSEETPKPNPEAFQKGRVNPISHLLQNDEIGKMQMKYPSLM